MEDKLNPFTEAQSDDYDFVLNAVSKNFNRQKFILISQILDRAL